MQTTLMQTTRGIGSGLMQTCSLMQTVVCIRPDPILLDFTGIMIQDYTRPSDGTFKGIGSRHKQAVCH